MKKLLALFLTFLTLLIAIPFTALAAEFPVPEGDVAAILLNIATNYKTLGFLGIMSGATILTVQAIKHFITDEWKFKRLLTLLISILYSICSGLIIPGSNVASVVITVFFTSGGAMALYEALKGAGIIKKS